LLVAEEEHECARDLAASPSSHLPL
jgi:hypothetical protein